MELNIKPLQGSHEVEVQVTFRLPRGGADNKDLSFERIERQGLRFNRLSRFHAPEIGSNPAECKHCMPGIKLIFERCPKLRRHNLA